jgi:hypothetical protein
MDNKLTVGFLLCAINSFCQISPPGISDANVAFWSALGLSQELSEKWSLSVYAGNSRQSDPDNMALFKNQAIFVINEETTFEFNNYFSLSACASYRVQNRYQSEEPFSPADPAMKNEERYYLRFYFREQIGKTKFKFSFRPELRKFSSAGHRPWSPVDEEVRLRLKGQASIPLGNPSKQLIISNEILAVTGRVKIGEAEQWSGYTITEDRLATFYRHVFPHVVADFGVMHQIMHDGQYRAHVAFDLVLMNPFNH